MSKSRVPARKNSNTCELCLRRVGIVKVTTKSKDPSLCWCPEGYLCLLQQLDNAKARIAELEAELAQRRSDR